MSRAERRKAYAQALQGPKPPSANSPWTMNTQAGNVRAGESYRTEFDPASGRTVHVYRAQPGLKARRVYLSKRQAGYKV